MKTKRNIKKRRNLKSKSKKRGGSLENGVYVTYFELLQGIHTFFTTPFKNSLDVEKFLILKKMKDVLSSITNVSQIFNSVDEEKKLNEQNQKAFIDVLRHIFKNCYMKFDVNPSRSMWGGYSGYSPQELEFAQTFLTKVKNVFQNVQGKVKEDRGNYFELLKDYESNVFKPETDLFNNCCSLLTWNIDFSNPNQYEITEGETYLYSIIAFMMSEVNEMGQLVVGTNPNIPIAALAPYVDLRLSPTVMVGQVTFTPPLIDDVSNQPNL
uniref:Uncharacterized protein n=1 Tax=viral metagenome TaxID=1070528 RepID=A0A6C0KWI2_9ZZZZ